MSALQTVQAYVHGMEQRDKAAVAATLAENVQHVFPFSPGGAQEIMGIFDGHDEVMGYFDAFVGKFRSLVWTGKRWTESADGKTVFLEARGDAVVEHSGESYRNTYVERFDVEDGKIVRIFEYADIGLYVGTGIAPTELEIQVVQATPERTVRLAPMS
jgi:ketosteroid isomerase-like protein